MTIDYPDDLLYRDSHEWLTTDEPRRVGVSDFAQDELGDVVFVELPEPGDPLAAGDAFGVIESIKAVSDLYSPVEGEVVAANEALFDRPELVNEDPYGDGWLLKVEVATEGDLLSAEDYQGLVA
jgi:glycine cleavage system H protein